MQQNVTTTPEVDVKLAETMRAGSVDS